MKQVYYLWLTDTNDVFLNNPMKRTKLLEINSLFVFENEPKRYTCIIFWSSDIMYMLIWSKNLNFTEISICFCKSLYFFYFCESFNTCGWLTQTRFFFIRWKIFYVEKKIMIPWTKKYQEKKIRLRYTNKAVTI